MRRTMHVVIAMPVEVLDDFLTKEDVASLILRKLELSTKRLQLLGATATVYAVREERGDED